MADFPRARQVCSAWGKSDPLGTCSTHLPFPSFVFQAQLGARGKCLSKFLTGASMFPPTCKFPRPLFRNPWLLCLFLPAPDTS